MPDIDDLDGQPSRVLDSAARLFATKGYAATTMREIAADAGMLPSSLYYHFDSKVDILVAVYQVGAHQLISSVMRAIERESDPWRRLETLCAIHLETILQRTPYARVLVRIHPSDIPGAADKLRALREDFESLYRRVIDDLPTLHATDRRSLRLMLLGALNWTAYWFNEKGDLSPRALAKDFVNLIKDGLYEPPSS